MDQLTHSIKKYSVYALVTATAILALLAVLSIWDLLAADILKKSLHTIFILGISSLIINLAARAYANDTPWITAGHGTSEAYPQTHQGGEKPKVMDAKVIAWLILALAVYVVIGGAF